MREKQVKISGYPHIRFHSKQRGGGVGRLASDADWKNV